MSSVVPAQSRTGSQTEDRYAALAELDNELSTTVSTGSSVQGWEIGRYTHTHTQPNACFKNEEKEVRKCNECLSEALNLKAVNVGIFFAETSLGQFLARHRLRILLCCPACSLVLEVVISVASTLMDSENKYSRVIYLLCNSPACVLSSCSVHKSLCCCGRCPGNDHQPLSDQWQSSSCRCVRLRFGTFNDFFLEACVNFVSQLQQIVICQSI